MVLHAINHVTVKVVIVTIKQDIVQKVVHLDFGKALLVLDVIVGMVNPVLRMVNVLMDVPHSTGVPLVVTYANVKVETVTSIQGLV